MVLRVGVRYDSCGTDTVQCPKVIAGTVCGQDCLLNLMEYGKMVGVQVRAQQTNFFVDSSESACCHLPGRAFLTRAWATGAGFSLGQWPVWGNRHLPVATSLGPSGFPPVRPERHRKWIVWINLTPNTPSEVFLGQSNARSLCANCWPPLDQALSLGHQHR